MIVVQGRRAWDALRGASIFVGGGTGFFGKWLIGAVAEANRVLGACIRVTVLARDPDSFIRGAPEDPLIEAWPGDVRDFEFPRHAFSHVIHGAAPNAFDSPDEMYEITVGGTRRMAVLAARSSARLLYISSGAVYGSPQDLPFLPEDYFGAPAPTEPGSFYGQAKRMAEQFCTLSASAGCKPVIARCFAFVGPHLPLDKHFAIGNFIRDSLGEEAIRVTGDPGSVRSYLYAADLAVWLLTLLAVGEAGLAYNVGSDRPIAIGDLALRVRDILSPSKPVTFVGSVGPGRGGHYVPLVNRMRGLAVDVWTGLDEAIIKTARFQGTVL